MNWNASNGPRRKEAQNKQSECSHVYRVNSVQCRASAVIHPHNGGTLRKRQNLSWAPFDCPSLHFYFLHFSPCQASFCRWLSLPFISAPGWLDRKQTMSLKNTKHLPREWARMLSVLSSATYCDKGISVPDKAGLNHASLQATKRALPSNVPQLSWIFFLPWPCVTFSCCSVIVKIYAEWLKQHPKTWAGRRAQLFGETRLWRVI